VVEGVVLDAVSGDLRISVRPFGSFRWRCGLCRVRCGRYDRGRERSWRHLDFGTVRVWVVAQVPRVCCPEHGPTTAAVPWARHAAGHTREFDDTVAWCATRMSKSAIAVLMRVAWRTVGSIITRVVAELAAERGGAELAGLTRIGIDEVSYRRGHKYLVVVTDHDTGRLVWAAPGRDKKTLAGFFDALGPAGCQALRLVTADGADWIADLVAIRAGNARLCMDPFHVIAWAQAALDEVRRQAIREAKARGDTTAARVLYRSRYALWKRPEHLTDPQRAKLDWIEREHAKIHLAWQLREHLRAVFAADGVTGVALLDTWFDAANHSGLPAFEKLARKMQRFHDDICHTLNTGLSNALAEATNLQIRLLTRVAFGFHSVQALLALIQLRVGGYKINLPGRPPTN
jgi:transposase